jgi:hypothetical protein
MKYILGLLWWNYYYDYSRAHCWALAIFSLHWTYNQSTEFLARGISLSQGRHLHTRQHKHRINSEIFMPWEGFELTTPLFERTTAVHTSDFAAAVRGRDGNITAQIMNWSLCDHIGQLSVRVENLGARRNLCYRKWRRSMMGSVLAAVACYGSNATILLGHTSASLVVVSLGTPWRWFSRCEGEVRGSGKGRRGGEGERTWE